MPTFKQPYYLLDFNGFACKFILLVNDVPAFSYDDTGSVASHVPINQLILHSGIQHLSLVMKPMAGQALLTKKSHLEVKVKLMDAESNSQQTTDVAVFKPVEIPDPGLPEFRQQYTFKAEVPYTLEGWQRSPVIKTEPAIKADVVRAYQQIEQLLRNKDYAGFRRVFEQKLTEVDTSIYATKKETDDDWQEMIDYISDPAMQIKFNPEQAQMHFYGNDKLVTLLKPNHEPALYFENPKEKEEYQLPFLFHRKTPGQQLSVIR